MNSIYTSINSNEKFIIAKGYRNCGPIIQSLIKYNPNTKKYYVLTNNLKTGAKIQHILEEIEEVINLIKYLSRINYCIFHYGMYYNKTEVKYDIKENTILQLLDENENFKFILQIDNSYANFEDLLEKMRLCSSDN